MKFIYKTIIGLSALLISFAIFSPSKTAAEQSGLEISPAHYNFELKPADVQKVTVNISNIADAAMSYVMEAEDFSEVSEDGDPVFDSQKSDWIVFDQSTKEGVIYPKESKQIGFTINLPADAEPGGHYAAVFAKEVKRTLSQQTEVQVSGRVGTLILLSVAGEVSKSAEITQYKTAKFVWKGPVVFNMKVKNSGSVHYDSQGEVSIKPVLGAAVTVDLGKHTIIPNNVRNYQAEWSRRFPLGYYGLTFTAIDGNGQPVTVKATLWAIPLEIIIPIAIGLIISILIISYTRKRK